MTMFPFIRFYFCFSVLTLFSVSFGTCPAGFYPIPMSSSCFRFGKRLMNWTDARIYCRQHHSDLIHITDKALMDFIQTEADTLNLSIPGYWLGLNDILEEDIFQWLDGSAMTLNLFQYGQPNGKERQNCVMKSGQYSGWHDTVCSKTLAPVCELKDSTLGNSDELRAFGITRRFKTLLYGHVLDTLHTRDFLECALHCLRNLACEMFTFRKERSLDKENCFLLIFGDRRNAPIDYDKAFQRAGTLSN